MEAESPSNRGGLRSVAPRRLMAAHSMAPYNQGDLDAFCGLYSAINAIRMALAEVTPLAPSQCETLFHHGVRFLQRRGKLSAGARHGIARPLWRKLVNEVAQKAMRMTGVPLQARRIYPSEAVPPIGEVLNAIERLIDEGHPVLALLDGAYAHYTVLVGYSATRISLFDSYDYRWITRSSIDVLRDEAAARHQLDVASLTAIIR